MIKQEMSDKVIEQQVMLSQYGLKNTRTVPYDTKKVQKNILRWMRICFMRVHFNIVLKVECLYK